MWEQKLPECAELLTGSSTEDDNSDIRLTMCIPILWAISDPHSVSDEPFPGQQVCWPLEGVEKIFERIPKWPIISLA